MKQFPSTDLKQRTGAVLHAAEEGDVEVTRHGAPRYVLMSKRRYDSIVGTGDQRAYHVDTAPDDERALMAAGLRKLLDDE